MAIKSLLLVIFVAFVLVTLSAPEAEAILSAQVTGTVFCTNGTANATTPRFPNANVQVICGNNILRATGTTNQNGVFTIFVPIFFPPLCIFVVTTPLSTCNATLPNTGRLVSQVLFNGFAFIPFPVPRFIPAGFVYTNP